MRKRVWGFVIAGLGTGLLVILFTIPCIKIERFGYTCCICGAHKYKEITRVAGLPVWRGWTGVRISDTYTKYIAEEHMHQWAGGPWSETRRTLCGPVMFSDGAHSVPPFPRWQYILNSVALRSIEQVKDWPAERKIRLYHLILARNDRDWLQEIRRMNKMAEAGDPNRVWTGWLADKSE